MSGPRSPASVSEGEILSGDEEKAMSTQTSPERDSMVNTSARPTHQNGSSSRASHVTNGLGGLSKDKHFHFRDPAGVVERLPERERPRSPFRSDRSRSRSPFRAATLASGEKRRREDDHYAARSGSDPRRFKVHYETDPPSHGPGRRPHRSYADLDRPKAPKSKLQYDERNERSRAPPSAERERGRDRSRSPFRHGKSERVKERRDTSPQPQNDGRAKMHNRGSARDRAEEVRRQSTPPVTERESTLQASRAKDAAKIRISLPQQSRLAPDGKSQDSLAQVKAAPESAPNILEAEAKLSEAEIIEQRRKRREAIKARHKSQPALLIQALAQTVPSAPATPAHESSGGAASEQQSPPSSINSPRTQHDSPPGSPAAFAVNDDDELVNHHHQQQDSVMHDEEGPSAADYDNIDMDEDRPEHKRLDLQGAGVNGVPAEESSLMAEPPPKASKEFDMFADDDDDDMFAPADATAKVPAGTKQAKTLDESLLDNWDYPDGHYRIILGELLDGRYAVQQQIGKGTFATVVRAQDAKSGHSVAVKIACNNDTMYKAGQKEMDMLTLLNQHDTEDKKHIIRLLRHFDHKGHLCLVFENLSADLREVLKKFGRNVGLNLKAIRSYAQQMFLALGHMKKCQILHADLKPDNILVSEKRNLLKICDLGTAAFAEDAEVTPYLVSRFYRAPEVILGMPFDYAIDMWSIGCTLFELYTGRILFAGATNNQMLRVIQECRGKVPIRMLKRSTLAEKHFDLDGNFFSREPDKITGKEVVRQINFNKTAPGKDLKARLSNNAKGLAPAEVKEHAAFVDLMDKCLQLDPARRISPNDALRHGFIAHATTAAVAAASSVGEGKANRVVPAMAAPRVK